MTGIRGNNNRVDKVVFTTAIIYLFYAYGQGRDVKYSNDFGVAIVDFVKN